MFAIVPPIVPEEVLAYFWARTVALNGTRNGRGAMGAEFGAPWRVIDAWLPRGLREIAADLAVGCDRASPEHWATRHTAYPYFASTLSAPQASRLLCRMVGRGSGPVRSAQLLTLTEYTPSAVSVCGECLRESIRTFGVPAIQRSWTLPYITWCAVHGRPLVPVASSVDCPTPYAKRVPSVASENAAAIADWSAALLDHGDSNPGWSGPLAMRRVVAQALGKATLSAVLDAVTTRWSAGTGHPALDAVVHDRPELAALLQSFLLRAKRHHPILAILIGAAFCSGARRLLVATADAPLEAPETPSEEKLTPGLVRALLARLKSIGSAADSLRISATTLAEFCRRHSIPFGERPSKLRPFVVARIEAAIVAGTLPAEVARREGVSPCSVYRVLKRNAALAATFKRTRLDGERAHRRGRWQALQRANPDCSMKQLRQLAPADFSWLYRHDRDFLGSSKARKPPTRRCANAPLWRRANRVVVDQLLGAANRLMQSKERPRFASLPRITSAAGLPRYLADRIRENEELMRKLQTAGEDRSAFVRRRLEWAANTVAMAGHEPREWRVHRVAALRATTLCAFVTPKKNVDHGQ